MDSTITSSALEEICSAGPTGLPLLSLYTKLLVNPPFNPNSLSIKQSLWTNLLKIPTLKFFHPNNIMMPISNTDHCSIQSVKDAEKLGIIIVGDECLRDCFVGLYDLKARDGFKGFSKPQRRALERLAIARTNGITQNQLAKEFGMEGNEIFYVVKNLECQGLVVRQSTILKTKGFCNEGNLDSKTAIATNMLYLSRYAKQMGSQQRLEITKDKSAENASQGWVEEDVLVNDFLPAMKAICDKLEGADRKVLVVKDIKQDLGYRLTSGHRAWRYVRQKLIDAGIVEEFIARVNNKVVPCLRLLKEFSPKVFEPKTLRCGNDDANMEQLTSVGKRGQVTDQLVELPMEHQIYDIVDGAGSKGLTVIEVCKRLGIGNKKYYHRLVNMFSRFGMPLRAEGHNRGTTYRVWTSRNFNSDSSNAKLSRSENLLSDNAVSNLNAEDLACDKLALTISECAVTNSEGDVTTSQSVKNLESEPESSQDSERDGQRKDIILYPSNTQEKFHCISSTAGDAQLGLVNVETESDTGLFEISPPVIPKPLKTQSHQKHPSLTAEREQRILERLKEEKFIIRPDLQRWLESFEKDKCTTMDTKTLKRILNKLQEQGQCKCITVSVPIVTNLSRRRTKDVIIHPSFQSLPPELLNQIYDRLRSFEIECRGQGLTRLKNDVSAPVLEGVQQAQNNLASDAQGIRCEAMRANGYIFARMIRVKLLHLFLWGYLSSAPDWDDALLSGKHGYDMENPHSTCKLFALDDAIKAIPLELFLQVVGSTQEFNDMIEKCRSGLRLADLTVQEYKCLMDTQATCRLSSLIDILVRLKLIRLVTDGNSEDEGTVLRANFGHAIELKPYIEEPCSIFSPSSAGSLDLRPQIRHDFMLLSREAVDDYWRTLEYCYSAADSVTALHAFPGSGVHELFLPRSWSSVRVMTVDKRAELLKCIMSDDPYKKLSYKECEKIAKDLDLTLRQVLLVYYDKRRKRLNRFQGILDAEGEESIPVKRKRSSVSRKKLRSSESTSLKPNDAVADRSGSQRHAKLSGNLNELTEEQSLNESSIEQQDQFETIEEQGDNAEDEHFSSVSQCMKPTQQRRFSWTEKEDRKLVAQYARHRATLGAKFHRIDWASLTELPGPPEACKRRMAKLNKNKKFRKALMNLCNMLSERYARHLRKIQSGLVIRDDSGMTALGLTGQECDRELFKGCKHVDDNEEQWDNFENKNIKMAFDEVIEHKWMVKLQASTKEVDQEESELICDNVRRTAEPQAKCSRFRLNRNHIPQKLVKIFSEGRSVSKHAYESLAVSNAVELFKLIFLSTSTAAEVAETLRRYSEHDLFAAFSYLREKKIMIGGTAGSSFELSQQFVQRFSSSTFPANTGERASNFVKWLHEREKGLTEGGVNLTGDLECGDIIHLFALVSSGELSVVPCLPGEGVGEAEDLRGLKRKEDNNKISVDDKAKKLKLSFTTDNQMISRRDKGFPGISLNLHRAAFSREFALELFKDRNVSTEDGFIDYQLGQNTENNLADSDNVLEHLNFSSSISVLGISNESIWEAMTCYAERLMLTSNEEKVSPLYPELFNKVYASIQKAGDQGLTMKQVSEIIDVNGEDIPELIVETLQAFGRALQVNAYDSVHVVDALYRSKYSLISVSGFSRVLKSASLPVSKETHDSGQSIILHNNHGTDDAISLSSLETDDIHRVTILNLPANEESRSSIEMQARKRKRSNKSNRLETVYSAGGHDGKLSELPPGHSRSFVPILPWINGDGTVNHIMYRGLVRRVIGIVMLNPGILEDDIIRRMDMLNPQSCRKLLELLILDNHLTVRKMHQTISGGPPSLFGSLLGKSFKMSKSIWREHFFANPMSTHLL